MRPGWVYSIIRRSRYWQSPLLSFNSDLIPILSIFGTETLSSLIHETNCPRSANIQNIYPKPAKNHPASNVRSLCCECTAPTTTSNHLLRWRHNEWDGVSNHQPHDCLLNRLSGRISKKTSKPRVTGLCVGNSPGTGEFPAQMVSNAETVSIWGCHHATPARTSKKSQISHPKEKLLIVSTLTDVFFTTPGYNSWLYSCNVARGKKISDAIDMPYGTPFRYFINLKVWRRLPASNDICCPFY